MDDASPAIGRKLEQARATHPSASPLKGSVSILGMRIDPVDYGRLAERIVRWAKSGESRTVCVPNVQMVMEGVDNSAFRAIVNESDMRIPDGTPLFWIGRLRGAAMGQRLVGSEMTLLMCKAAAAAGVPVGFHGGRPEVLEALTRRVREQVPALRIVYAVSPPFRPLTAEEDAEVVNDINASGAGILFVGLGCPKQERWMAAHRGRVNAVMLGVGWAFEILAGYSRTAPHWMQVCGLEWVFRIMLDRKRFGQYLRNNTRFLLLFSIETLLRRHRRG